MTVPFLDLRSQYKDIEGVILSEVTEVLASGQYVLGEKVEAFEDAFANFCGCQFGVAVNSGTSALHLALRAYGVGPGDEVITVSSTFVATIAAIEYCNAVPVYIDVDPQNLLMDPAKLEVRISAKTRAILPVHLHGHPAPMDEINDVAARYGIPVIEDASQAHGALYKDRPVGSLGNAACFSFYPGKNLGAYGEGGAVVTSDAAIAQKVRMLRDWGQVKKYQHSEKGFNYRMDAIQGAVLGVKLRHLPTWTVARQKAAKRYLDQLDPLALKLPAPLSESQSVYHVFAIRVPERSRIQECLASKEIGTAIHYPIPVHLQAAYRSECFPEGSLPHSELAAQQLLSLPMFPEITEAQQNEVVEALCEALHG